MRSFENLRKINFDGVGYLTPSGIRDMLKNEVEFPSVYNNVIGNDQSLIGKEPFQLVFMQGGETVTLYDNLNSNYGIKLDLSYEHRKSYGIIEPTLCPDLFSGKKLHKRFSKTCTMRVKLYGFFRLIKYNSKGFFGGDKVTFYLQATNNSYVEGMAVDKNYYCNIYSNRIEDHEDEEIPYPLTTVSYNSPYEEFIGRVFYSEDSVVSCFKAQRVEYEKISAEIEIEDMNIIETNIEENLGKLKKETLTKMDKVSLKSVLKILGILLVESVHNDKKFGQESELIIYLESLYEKRLEGAVYGLQKRNLQTIFALAKEVIINDIPNIRIDEKNFRRLNEAIKLENK